MNRLLTLLIHLSLIAGSLPAQVDLLTLRDSESIVERVPAVAAARRQGECPQLSGTYLEADDLLIQARRGCGPDGGTLINNYSVNRRTGAVTLSGDNPLRVSDRAGEAFARQLVAQARTRVLSNDEARCVALEAAKALPGWGDADAAVSVEMLGKVERGQLHFSAKRRSLTRPADSGQSLSVDLGLASIRDDETGWNLFSGSLGALRAKMLALREPPWLTDEDAISIVQQIPAVASGARGCRLWAGGAFWSDEVQVGLSCEGKQAVGRTVVAVNLRTGQTNDADTGKTLESAESIRVARELLAERERRKLDLQKEVNAACSQQ